MDTKYQRSQRVQGGLEIPLKVVIEMEVMTRNRETFNKYKQLAVTSYKELDRNGLFDDCAKDILQELQQDDDVDSDKESSHAETNREHRQDYYVVN